MADKTTCREKGELTKQTSACFFQLHPRDNRIWKFQSQWGGYGVWMGMGFRTKEFCELRTCWQYCSYVSWMHQALLA